MFEQFLEQLSQQLGETVALVSDLPGSLPYHLAILAFLAGGVVNALYQVGQGRSTYHIRLALGMVSLFTLQLTYFFIIILGNILPVDSVNFLPPIDRAVGLLSILLILWLLAFPVNTRVGDVLTGLGLVFILIASVVAVWVWYPIAQSGAVAHPGCNMPDVSLTALFFNCTQYELPWEIAKLGLLGIGLIGYLLALVARRQADWFLASGYAAIMLTGHVLHFIYSSPANVAGIERLAELLALPFFLAVLYRRLHQPSLTPPSAETIPATPSALEDTAPRPAVAPRPIPLPLANAINSKAALALASLPTTTDRDELIQIICVAMAHTFRAEACGWLDAPDRPGGPRLAGGYDVAREQFITARPFMLSETPEVAAALKQTQPMRLTLDETMSDLRRVARAMGREPTTPVLMVPLRHEGGPVLGALFLFTAQTTWSPDEHSLLAALSDSMAATLQQATQTAQWQDNLDAAHTQAAEAQQSFASAQASLSQVAEELNSAREQAQKRAAELSEAQAEIERQRQTADRLATQLQTQQQAEASQIGLMGEVNELRHKLLFAQHEAEDHARLESELDAALARIEALAEFENKLEAAQREVEEYREQEGQLRAELKQLRTDWTQHDPTVTRVDPTQLQQELALTRAELGVAQALAPVLAAAQTELAEKARQLTQTQTRETEWLSEIEQTRAQAVQWQSEIDSLRAELEHMQAAQFELTEKSATMTQWQNREADLLAEIDQIRAEAQADLAEVNTLLALTQEQEQKAQHEIQRLQSELAQGQPLVVTQTEVAAAQARAEQASSDVEQLRLELSQAAAAQAELARLTERLAQTQTQEDQLQQEVETLRSGLAQMQALGPTLAATKIALADVTADLARAQAQETRLRQELEQARAQPGSVSIEAEQLNQDLERLRLELNRAISQRMALQVQLDDKTRALTLLQTELFERTNELDALRQDYQEQALEVQQELVQARSQLERGGTRPLQMPASTAQPAEGQTTADLEVVSSLTQELRQPMSSINGYTDLLLSESVGILGALQRKFLERIKASAERMGALLDDLIHVTVLDSGALELKSESLDVAMVIEEAVMGCEAQFRERGVELILDITPEPPRLNADRDALRQIFTHLLNNAAAVSPSDSEVTLTVRREVEPGNRLGEKANYLFISVSDAGGGIAPEDHPRVFSRLYRADSPLVAGLGDTGVGLSMVKALVEAHGGRVWVESELKKGSVFHVLMPLEQPVSKNGSNGAVSS